MFSNPQTSNPFNKIGTTDYQTIPASGQLGCQIVTTSLIMET